MSKQRILWGNQNKSCHKKTSLNNKLHKVTISTCDHNSFPKHFTTILNSIIEQRTAFFKTNCTEKIVWHPQIYTLNLKSIPGQLYFTTS